MMKPGAELFLNLAMFTHEQDWSEITVHSLARLFVPVTLIRLFFKKWFTYFCDIYVFLLQFRIKIIIFFLNPQFHFKKQKIISGRN